MLKPCLSVIPCGARRGRESALSLPKGTLCISTPRRRKHHIVGRLRWTVFQSLHHIAQIHRTPGVHPDHHQLQFLGVGKELPRLDLKFAVIAGKTARLSALVRRLQLQRNCPRCQPVGRKLLSLEYHAHRARLPADDGGLGNVVELLDGVLEFSRRLPQPVRVVVRPPKCQRQNGHVVN